MESRFRRFRTHGLAPHTARHHTKKLKTLRSLFQWRPPALYTSTMHAEVHRRCHLRDFPGVRVERGGQSVVCVVTFHPILISGWVLAIRCCARFMPSGRSRGRRLRAGVPMGLRGNGPDLGQLRRRLDRVTVSIAIAAYELGIKNTLYLWQPQDFNLCEQRNTLVFSGTPSLACKAKMRRSAALGRGWVKTYPVCWRESEIFVCVSFFSL